MRFRRLLLSLLAALAGTLPASAQTDQNDPNDPRASTLAPDATLTPRPPGPLFAPEKAGSSQTQMAGYLVALLVLVGGGFYFMKRGLPLRGSKLGENHLHLLETKMLGNRQFLVVVKYEDSKMLLGVGPGQIQYLCSLESADDDMERLIRQGGPTSGPDPA